MLERRYRSSSKAALTDTLCKAPETAPFVAERQCVYLDFAGDTATAARPARDQAGRAVAAVSVARVYQSSPAPAPGPRDLPSGLVNVIDGRVELGL